jgi:LuxR family transcriptional regulator of csgAB operon
MNGAKVEKKSHFRIASPKPPKVNIHITGSQRMINELICGFLNTQDEFSASEGPVGSSISLMSATAAQKPDVMMLDNYSGEVLDKLNNECEEYLGLLKGTPAIVFNFKSPKRLKKWISYGVRGVIYDQDPPQNMIKAIKAVVKGHMWFPRQAMSNFLIERWAHKESIEKATSSLTNRELEILVLIAKGRTNKEIAESLYISPLTVKAHVQNIYRKIGVPNRVKAVIWANENVFLS